MPETQLQPIKFAPSKLAQIAPDVSLQRYLEIGLRPSLRKFDEFRSVVVSPAGLSRHETNGTGKILGSAIVKSGSTSVICSISAGVVEDSQELTNDYSVKLDKDIIEEGQTEAPTKKLNASVFTVVEISRGRNGPPTEEEMSLSQSLYQTVLHSGLISKANLKIQLGLKSKDENGEAVFLKHGDNEETNALLEEFKPKKSFSYVLYAKIVVYSRTGPLFDLCHGALVAALKNTQLPEMYVNEKETDVKVSTLRPRRKGDNNGVTDMEEYDLVCSAKESYPLVLNKEAVSWSSTFAVADLVKNADPDAMDQDRETSTLLADPEGEAEENIANKIRVVSAGKKLVGVEIRGGLTRAQIKRATELAGHRAKSMA